jgi:hypothetical protein
MSGTCDVCKAMGAPRAKPGARLRRILVGGHMAALCATHAARVPEGGVESFDELRALFVESSGRRLLLGRRSLLERRTLPRPEGRRMSNGRRTSDS